MHCTLDRVGSTRALELSPAQPGGDEQIVALGAFMSLMPSVIATASPCLIRYGIAKQTHASPNIAKTALYGDTVNPVRDVLMQDLTPNPRIPESPNPRKVGSHCSSPKTKCNV